MLLTIKNAETVLNKCLETGADFAELFVERKINDVYVSANGIVIEAGLGVIKGVGIRILKGTDEAYGHTSNLKLNNLLILAGQLASSFQGERVYSTKPLVKVKVKNNHKAKIDPITATSDKKVSYLTRAYQGAKQAGEFTQISATLASLQQNVEIYNSNGLATSDLRVRTRLAINCVASDGKSMQALNNSYGRSAGLEIYDKLDIEKWAKETGEACLVMLKAEEFESQTLPVIVNNHFGGVLLHEACVHSLEATAIAKGMSVFNDKKGTKIASDLVTAIDDGTLKNNWGSLNIDDEGHPTQKNILIENGILKSYLFDAKNQRRMNEPLTGSGRRESYKYSPTSRMNNTFIANGKSTVAEIIRNTKYGFFAKKLGGGSVNPVTGEFNFAVQEGYMVRNGKIAEPRRAATLVGTGKDLLLRIDMVGNNLSYGQGMCGSLSGSVPTDVGQPMIRVSSMTVGGKNSVKENGK
jgi:TldD protein